MTTLAISAESHNDYPHRDGTWPYSQQAIDEQFVGVIPEVKHKMLWENAARLCGLGR
jgi:predicted TIM-barrel fold metal-dependent hydrolase